MSSKNRPGNPASHSGERTSASWWSVGRGLAAKLAGRAGTDAPAEPSFEALEGRQMLFALALDPFAGGFLGDRINQANGAAFANFGYAIPLLQRNLPDPTTSTPQTITENFDTVDLTTLPGGVVPDGFQFLTSQLTINHTIAGGFTQPGNLVTPLLVTAPGSTTDIEFRARLQQGETLSYSFNAPLLSFSFRTVIRTPAQPGVSAGDPDLDLNLTATGTRVQLLKNNVVVSSFSPVAAAIPGDTTLESVRQLIIGPPNEALYTLRDPGGLAFDTVRVVRIGNNPVADDILFDDIVGTPPPGLFVPFINPRLFGGTIGISGGVTGALDAAISDIPNQIFISRNFVENFTNEAVGPRASGYILPNSRLQLVHNLAANPAVAAVAGNNKLAFTFSNTTAMELSVVDADPFRNKRAMLNFTFSLPNAQINGQTQIELIRNGRVVRTVLANDPNLPAPTQPIVGETVLVLDARNTFTTTLGVDTWNDAFDTVRVTRTAAGNTTWQMDRVTAFHPTMVEVSDLYGRSMQLTTALGTDPNNTNIRTTFIDSNDDGVPDFNDGIGRIEISNATSATNLFIGGGALTFNSDFGFYEVISPTALRGNYAAIMQGRFGFYLEPATQDPPVRGLPPGSGTIVIGSPYFRDNTDAPSYHGNRLGQSSSLPTVRPKLNPSDNPIRWTNDPSTGQVTSNFITQPLEDNLPNNPGVGVPLRYQGVFVPNGQNIGSVNIDGTLLGNSRFGGAVGRLSVGYLPGSVAIEGDLGQMYVNSDAGAYFVTPLGVPPPLDGPTPGTGTTTGGGPVVRTGSKIVVGRTAGTISIAGRNYADIAVQGDLNNATRQRLDLFRFYESETMYGLTPPGDLDPNIYFRNLTTGAVFVPGLGWNYNPGTPATRFNPNTRALGTSETGVFNVFSSAVQLGDGPFRNDGLMNAEYIGNLSRGVVLSGSLGGFNPVPSAEDTQDVFAFSAIGGQQLSFNVTFAGSQVGIANARIVDSRGRTVASHQAPFVSANRTPENQTGSVQMRFTPEATDVYYIVLTAPPTGNAGGFTGYQVNISGTAPSTLGMLSVGANMSSLLTVNGSVGLIRAGGGIGAVEGAGESSPAGSTILTVEGTDDLLTQRGMSVSVSGDVGAMLFGTSLDRQGAETNNFIISGSLGTLRAGFNTTVATNRTIGDIAAMNLSVGKDIGTIESNAGMGYRSTPFGTGSPTNVPVGPVFIRAGAAGGPGSIGSIIVGTIMSGDQVTVTTSDNSTIDRFVVGTPGLNNVANNGTIFNRQPTLNLGLNSDIRFADFGAITNQNGTPTPVPGVTQQLAYNVPLFLTDDSGVPFSITITGGTSARASAGSVLLLPVQGSQGVAVARITVNLVGGADLVINSSAPGVVSIGRIVVTTDNGTRRSNIKMVGFGQIDVLKIDQPAGAGLDSIVNSTIDGDIVAADVRGLNTLNVLGSLGRTEVSPLSPPLLGPFLGIGTTSQAFNGVLGIDPSVLNSDPTAVYTPITERAFGDQRLDDWGAPFDAFLNGIVVRTGNVRNITASKNVGDVILQDPAGRVETVVANADGSTPPGGFEGIVGSIYAFDIGAVDVGSGLITSPDSPFADAGIFAVNDIQSVTGGRIRGAVISGVIIAGNAGATTRRFNDGIGTITLTNGRFENAYIASANLDAFWQASRVPIPQQLNYPDAPRALGPVNAIRGNNSPIFKSTILGATIGNLDFSGTFFDATTVESRGTATSDGTITNISAGEFRNSTVGGEELEWRPLQIIALGNVNSINASGDISDMLVDIAGSLNSGIRGRNITRLSLDVDRDINNISATGDLRSSQITGGLLRGAQTFGDIRSTTFNISGPIQSIQASGAITNAAITSTGASGRIDYVRANQEFSGDIRSSGKIQYVQAGTDFSGSVRTTSTTNGDLGYLAAGGDLLVTLDIKRDVQTIQAGKSIGRRSFGSLTNRDSFDITGTLGSVNAGGQIYADMRVGQTIGTITQGRAFALPNTNPNTTDTFGADRVSDATITAYGRIQSINITGDFGGAILSYSGGIGSVNVNNGSIRPSAGRFPNAIEARDGDIGNVSVNNGHLLGNIVATDGSIGSLNVNGSGPFGNIGIDRTLSANSSVGVPAGQFRNQLPPGLPAAGAQRDGVVISAALDIGSINAGRSVFESTIQAGRRLGSINVQRNITTNVNAANINFLAKRTIITAGDEIASLNVSAAGLGAGDPGVLGLFMHAGLTSLGADNLPGGVGVNADTVRSGKIGSINIGNSAQNSQFLAGVEAGADGLYTGAGDDTVAPGLSSVQSVSIRNGAALTASTLVAADIQPNVPNAPAGLTIAGSLLPVTGGVAFTGSTAGFVPIPATGLAVTDAFANAARLRFAGTGQAFWDAVGTRIVLVGTGLGSSLTVEKTGLTTVTLQNLFIQSTDDSSLGSLQFNGVALAGNSGAYIDGEISNANLDLVTDAPTIGQFALTTKTFRAGQRIGNLTVGQTGSATPNTLLIASNFIGSVNFRNSFSNNRFSRIDAIDIQSLNITGDSVGVINASRDIGSVNISGALNGRIRAGNNIQSVNAASASSARISARGNLGSVNIRGDVADSAFYAGADLGADGTFGATDIPGLPGSADTITNGNIQSLYVGGNFDRSDVAAGVSRGPSNFINNSDRLVADGRSTISSVRINGQRVGSGVSSQNYGVLTNGTLNPVYVNNAIVTQAGNFAVKSLAELPRPLRVESYTTQQVAPQQFAARLVFNQNINVGTNNANILAALQVAEVRNDPTQTSGFRVLPNLVGGNNFTPGVDFTVAYNATTFTLTITFSTAITSRDLQGQAAGPLGAPLANTSGPGIYRFTILGGDAANALRGATNNARLDGDSSGTIATSDNFVEFMQVGDAGDRLNYGRGLNGGTTVDFYAPVNLDLLMHSWRNLDGMPDRNTSYTVRGVLGDHPDTNIADFASGSDADVYTISLRAGQILRLGDITGNALLAERAIYTATGTAIYSSFLNAVSTQLGVPNPRTSFLTDTTLLQPLDGGDPYQTAETFLVKQTGQYSIVVIPSPATTSGKTSSTNDFNGPLSPPAVDFTGNTVINTAPVAGAMGDYAFTLSVFDDGDSGFFGNITPLNSALAAAAPVPADFQVGTAGELQVITVNDLAPTNADGNNNPTFVFQLFPGANNILGDADDVIVGTNGRGLYATRIGAGPVTLTRSAAAGVVVTGTQGTAATFNNNVPQAAAFANATSTITVAPSTAGMPGFVFQRLAGPDAVWGNNDDVVTVTALVRPGVDNNFGTVDDVLLPDAPSSLGVNITRVAGNGLAFNAATDIVRFTSDSGDGNRLASAAPRPSDFAGPDSVLGTPDDLRVIGRGDYTFRLVGGGFGGAFTGNGVANIPSKDKVIGTDRFGNSVQRTAGTDGIFGTTDDGTLYSSAIGALASAGIPATTSPDVDVYHLNSGQPIAAGTRFRITLKLAETGGNIGLLQPVRDAAGNIQSLRLPDTRGSVQFGFFDTTLNAAGAAGANGTNITNSTAVATSSNVIGYSGNQIRTGQVVRNGDTGNAYGFDANGDYFMEFSTPESLQPAGVSTAGTFAVYVQGTIRSDYQLEVTPLPAFTPPASAPATRTQNILIETRGGTLNWLEANPYRPTQVGAFDAAVNSFSGVFNNEDVNRYIIDSPLNANNLVNRLQRMFDAALGAGRVTISTDASAFEGQDFSTLFISSSNEPPAFYNNGRFGEAQLVDPFNSNTRDQAVVFTPALNLQGFPPTQTGVDQFIGALTAASARRLGELLGVRMTTTMAIAPPAVRDTMATDVIGFNDTTGNSTRFTGGTNAQAPNAVTPLRPLASQFDGVYNAGFNAGQQKTPTAVGTTQFFLGQQATVALLNRVIFKP